MKPLSTILIDAGFVPTKIQMLKRPCSAAQNPLNFMTHLVAVFGLMAFLAAASAQNFSLDSFTTNGSIITSTGTVYSVSGSFGQPNEGVSSSQNYSLVGIFWAAAVAVQTPGAPKLIIQDLNAGSAKLSWMPATPGFLLQQASSLNATSSGWSNAPVAYTNGVTIPASSQMRFFRLIKP